MAGDSTGAVAERPHHEGHRQRLRERFLAAPAALPDYELLELLLTLVEPRRDTKELAKAMLARYDNSLGELLAAPVAQLCDFPLMSEARAVKLKLIHEAAVRMGRAQVLNKPVIASWDKLLDYCRTAIAFEKTEQFRLLFLDRKNVLIADEVQQRGTVDHAPVYPREVVKRALELNASALIMVHNHPSGDTTPSKSDIEMTRQVREAARAVGVALHDHLIIGRGGHTSFKSQGLL